MRSKVDEKNISICGSVAYEARSAVCWADEINVPVLIIHSKGDTRVPYEQAQTMANALQKAGKDCTLITYDDDVHGSHVEDLEIRRRWLNGENVSSKSEIRKKCESAIADKFNLNIFVTIISAKDLSAALRNAPTWWDKDIDSRHNAIFVIPPATVTEIIEQVGIAKPEYEQVSYYGQVIFWSAPIKTFSRTRWAKIVGKSAYHNVTIRNANTTKKILQLSE